MNFFNNFFSLEDLKPFIAGDNRDRFIFELKSIPNYEQMLKTLISSFPDWVEKVNENGVYFYLDEVPYSSIAQEIPQNAVELRLFQQGTFPTIKVIKYRNIWR